jgi:hypothetical protein
LRRVDVALSLDLLDAHSHTIFREHDVFGLELGGGRVTDLAEGKVDVVADEGEDPNSDEQEDQWEEFTERSQRVRTRSIEKKCVHKG